MNQWSSACLLLLLLYTFQTRPSYNAITLTILSGLCLTFFDVECLPNSPTTLLTAAVNLRVHGLLLYIKAKQISIRQPIGQLANGMLPPTFVSRHLQKNVGSGARIYRIYSSVVSCVGNVCFLITETRTTEEYSSKQD